MLLLLLFWLSTFIPSNNLDEVFTYNHMALMSLRSRSHVKASMVLMRADHLFIHNYIRSLLNIMLTLISMGRTKLEPVSGIKYIYIYIFNIYLNFYIYIRYL